MKRLIKASVGNIRDSEYADECFRKFVDSFETLDDQIDSCMFLLSKIRKTDIAELYDMVKNDPDFPLNVNRLFDREDTDKDQIRVTVKAYMEDFLIRNKEKYSTVPDQYLRILNAVPTEFPNAIIEEHSEYYLRLRIPTSNGNYGRDTKYINDALEAMGLRTVCGWVGSWTTIGYALCNIEIVEVHRNMYEDAIILEVAFPCREATL